MPATAWTPTVADAPTPDRGTRRVIGSVRFRVTAAATAVVAAVLGVTALAMVGAQRRALTESLDDRVAQTADDLAVGLESGTAPAELFVGGGDETFTQLVLDDEVVAASAAIDGARPVREACDGDGDGDGDCGGFTDGRFFTVEGALAGEDAEDEFRVLTRLVDIDGREYHLVVGGALDEVNESVGVLTATLAVALPVLLVVLAALIWFVVSRALRPVEAIREEVVRIGGDDLGRRVPEPATHDEIARLARTMNEMLGRIEAAGDRQRAFVADASHELRSPLTSIRSELEVDLTHPESADLLATHRSVLEEAERLQRLVDDLLYLARRDAGAGDRRVTTVDLDDVVLREIARVAPEDGPAVDATGVSGAQVVGDADQLTRVVRNLLDNARRHATERVTVDLAEDGAGVVLTVADDGPGIAGEDAERVFERFTRLDSARDRAHGGTGLGLAITADIVAEHGGTVRVESRVDADDRRGATFVVHLPAAAPRAGA